MIVQDTYTLANGVEIPKLGLGTWLVDDEAVAEVVREAVEVGYRHVDTAQAYGNEAGVGEGIRTSGIPRDELFVTTKLAAEVKSHADALRAVDGSLEALGVDHVDLLLIHSPQPWQHFGGDDRFFEGNREAWRALEDAHRTGRARAIGVSNFQAADIDNIVGSCRTAPMVNQVLAHIANTPFELIERSRAVGMLVEAYSPIGHGQLLRRPALLEMAERYGVTVAQLGIRYDLQLGLLPLPKAANPAHLRTNADVDFEISEQDMAILTKMDKIEDYGDASAFPVYAHS